MISGGAKIVTFYSYKGGTGRSMALANVAWILASTGARVLVIDWDLEAPGLHRYFRPFLADPELEREESAGIIDFMVSFIQKLATPEGTGTRDAQWFKKHAALSQWSERLLWPSGEDAATGLGGFIDFVPAGRQDADYSRKVNSFDWATFYDKYNGGAFIDAMRRDLRENYDWVLIDSRTGVSDTSGICTMHLPDMLVVCFTLNYQSIRGAAAVAGSSQQGRKERLRVFPLPMRLDGNEERSLKAMMSVARSEFDSLLEAHVDKEKYWMEMGVPYFSRYAYSEKLSPFEVQVNVSTSILPSMCRVASYISDGAVNKMEPLPEEHRDAALQEFERLPFEEAGADPVPGPKAPEGSWALRLRRAWYWVEGNSITVGLLAALATAVAVNFRDDIRAYVWTPQNPLVALVADADTDLKANRRGHAALLLAEAASRLDDAAVVSADNEQTKGLYASLLALQPFNLGSGRGDSIQFSPDGKFVVVAASKWTATLYPFPPGTSGQSGRPVGYSAAAFSPDSQYLAVGGRQGNLEVVQTATGRRIWQWENPNPDSAWVTAIAFSPDGSQLAAGTDSGIVLLASVDPWKELRRFQHPKGVRLLAFSPDSRYAASAGDSGDVLWWSQRIGTAVERLGPHVGGVAAMAFGPTREPLRMITRSRDGVVRVWTQTLYLPLARLVETGQGQTAAWAVSRDGAYFAGRCQRGTQLCVWSTLPESSKETGTFPLPALPQFALALGGQTGNLMVQVVAGSYRAIENQSAEKSWDFKQDYGARGVVYSAVISPDNRYVAAGADLGSIFFLLRSQGKPPTLSAAEVRSLACSQTVDRQLTTAEWSRYFGTEPLRFTCGERAK